MKLAYFLGVLFAAGYFEKRYPGKDGFVAGVCLAFLALGWPITLGFEVGTIVKNLNHPKE